MGLKQHDMMMRVGMSRQQYQQLESKGNPRLDTLGLIAKGLTSELVLVPQEKLHAVQAILEGDSSESRASESASSKPDRQLSDDPWQGLLGDSE